MHKRSENFNKAGGVDANGNSVYHTPEYLAFGLIPPAAIMANKNGSEVSLWDPEALDPYRGWPGRLAAQIWLCCKYLPKGFAFWNMYLPEAQKYLCDGYRMNFGQDEWYRQVIFQSIILLVEFLEDRYATTEYASKHLNDKSVLRRILIELINEMVDYEDEKAKGTRGSRPSNILKAHMDDYGAVDQVY